MRLFLLACLLLASLSLLSAEVAVRSGSKVSSSTSYVRELTDDTFEHDTQASTGSTTGDWFVEFMAPWCGHCKNLSPIWTELADWVRSEQIPVSIAMVDATIHVKTAKRLDIRGFPTIKFFSKGQVYDYTGPRTLVALQKFLENREWLLPGVKVTPMPPEITTVEFLKDYWRETANELVMLVYRKPGGVSILVGIGVLVGILLSMLVFIVFLEPKPIVHPVNIGTPPSRAGVAATGSSSSSSGGTNSTVAQAAAVPPTNAGAKKAE